MRTTAWMRGSNRQGGAWAGARQTGVVAAALLCVLLLADMVSAQGNIRLGQMQVNLGLTYRGEYNDNIFYQEKGTEEDFIHTVTPSVGLTWSGAPGNYFAAGLPVDIVAYSDWSDNNYETFRPYLDFGLASPLGLYLKVRDNYVNTANPYGTETEYAVGRSTKRWGNTARATAGYRFATRYFAEATYQHYVTRFDEVVDQVEDRTDHTFGGALFYRVTPKTAVFVEYRRTVAEYDAQNDGLQIGPTLWTSSNSRDYNTNDYLVGVRFEPGGKISGEAKIGYGDKNADNKLNVNGLPYLDEDGFVSAILLNYAPQEGTALAFNFDRVFRGSTDVDLPSFVDTSVGLTLQQRLARRFSLTLGGSYRNSDYLRVPAPNPDKYFDYYIFNAGLGYDIKQWLRAGLDYRYTSKNASNSLYNDEEYDLNQVGLQLSGAF